MKLHDICASIPQDLKPADDLLHKYGRWCKDRARLHRCGSAERMYRAPQDDIDREPRPVLMHIDQAMACQRALYRVPEQERMVLTVLYVPRRIPVEVLLRRLRIPPRLSQERHLRGLRMFANRVGVGIHLHPPDARRSEHADASRQPAASLVKLGILTHAEVRRLEGLA